MAAILQTILSDALSWMKRFVCSLKISLKFVPGGRIHNYPCPCFMNYIVLVPFTICTWSCCTSFCVSYVISLLWIYFTYSPIFMMVASLALEQWYDWPYEEYQPVSKHKKHTKTWNMCKVHGKYCNYGNLSRDPVTAYNLIGFFLSGSIWIFDA